VKRRRGSIYDWMTQHADRIIYGCAAGEPVEDLIMRYQIMAAGDGFNKRQIRALDTAVKIYAAYVEAMRDGNAGGRGWSPEQFMGILFTERVRTGVMTPAEAFAAIMDLGSEVGW
jgi:hypothetical protein